MSREHRCSQCNLKFLHASKLERHFETHSIMGDWLCALCNTLVNRLSALILHWRNSCREMKQVFCEDELKRMTSEEVKVSAFRYTLDKNALEQTEIEAEGAGEVSHESSFCYYCYLVLPRGTVKYHYATHNGEKPAGSRIRNSIVPYFCDLCGYGFRFRKSLINHWRSKCTEVLVNVEEKDGVVIENRHLREKVEGLIKKAVLWEPVVPVKDKEKPEVESEEESEKEPEEREVDGNDKSLQDVKSYPETHDLFSGRIYPPPSFDRNYWNVDKKPELMPRCSECTDVQFLSQGRLDRHMESFHPTRKSLFSCELCHTAFKQHRVLMHHLRVSCPAMRVEEPDVRKRRRMTKEELAKVIEEGKPRWEELLAKKKEANLKFIEEYLSEVDKERPSHVVKPLLDVPQNPPTVGFESGLREHICELCKVSFNSPRFLQRHVQVAHHNERPKNQLTITATSLLPYFRLNEATFYDLEGREFKMGKVLDNESELAKHFKSKVIETGTKLNGEQTDCFILQLQGEKQQYVLLNEEEFREVCNADGRVKTLFSENPKAFGDIPVLKKEV